ncbi:replication factor C subunit 1-like [Pistacia vera]|uniref:replication factor C subunit 1-like n=1 Tax=Pistacia vera TaxID=55513 RepID=UPI001263D029|nr:replication factor C subunit 1-like [Pistacia vera]
MPQDIRKWFLKPHDKDKGNGNGSISANSAPSNSEPMNSEPFRGGKEGSGRRKTSKYFTAEKQKLDDEKGKAELPAKRKTQNDIDDSRKSPRSRKIQKVDDNDDDFVLPNEKRGSSVTPRKKLKSSSGRGVAQKSVCVDDGDEDNVKDLEPPVKPSGRGRGGRASGTPAIGRGRGGGQGGIMNFGERKDPPHKGEKEVPEGAPDCLAGLTFVISGTLDSLEREEAEDLIKRHGGRVTGSVSKKTNYLLCDEDIGGVKSTKAKELGTAFLTEDGLFDMIHASNPAKALAQDDSKKSVENVATSLPLKRSPQKVEVKSNSSATKVACESTISCASPVKKKKQNIQDSSLTWTEKHRPKVPNDIVGNQSLVNQLRNWLAHWNEQFLGSGTKQNGKKKIDPSAKKAVLLSGAPGMGKTTSAKLVTQMLGFQAIEVNASDSRGKADSKISKGIGGSNANSVKELVSNEALNSKMDRSKHPKAVLIMDEVDGMSAGDRGGVADLIASIKISKIPIICICNDRYSQKLKSLVNYCLLLSFRKPTKQQMAKRLMQIANAEGLQVNEIALEELAERVNGDMRMAINQLQYMSLSMSNIKYDDIRQRLLSSAKDEDISPFAAVDKLFGFNGGRLRMDERIDLSMSDPDLVPLLIQENYINYRPSSGGKDEMKRMSLIARAAESIGDGDIVNVQIRRYRQWQLSQTGCLASCIIPAALLHGQRETLEQGERNFNRFGGWLGKNSTTGKNLRLLEDLHVHLLASRESNSGRETLRLEYLTLLLKQLTDPLREMPKDEAVKKVVDFMNVYSISQEDFDTIVELSKFQGHGNPLEGIPPAVKAALTRAYKEDSKLRMVRAADLVTLPGKKAPKKRIAAILEPSDEGIGEENGGMLADSEEENSSDTEDPDAGNGEKMQKELQSLNSKGIEVQVELKGSESSSAKKKAAGRGKGGSASSEKKGNSGSMDKKAGRGSGAAAKRKR